MAKLDVDRGVSIARNENTLQANQGQISLMDSFRVDDRQEMLEQWLRTEQGMPDCQVEMVSGDASFRRYFRASQEGQSWIVMDAPPEKENCTAFIAVADALGHAGLNVPRVLVSDLQQGFLLLTDFGDKQYLSELDVSTAPALYRDAMNALLQMQKQPIPQGLIPDYTRDLLLSEMDLFKDWFVNQHLGIAMDHKTEAALTTVFDFLADAALEQPQRWVHRDYHSRNLMVVSDNNPGILDFQDAVTGPVTYDLVSLLRDCYISWPADQVRAWAIEYYHDCQQQGVLGEAVISEADFMRWFDLMGVQRHLKAIGIFSRLNIRDGKSGYLDDIPRTLNYVLQVSKQYPQLAGLERIISSQLLPALKG